MIVALKPQNRQAEPSLANAAAAYFICILTGARRGRNGRGEAAGPILCGGSIYRTWQSRNDALIVGGMEYQWAWENEKSLSPTYTVLMSATFRQNWPARRNQDGGSDNFIRPFCRRVLAQTCAVLSRRRRCRSDAAVCGKSQTAWSA
jgi:hypothetical protein